MKLLTAEQYNMTTPLRQFILKRGNTAVSGAYTGPAGEVTYDTTLNAIRVHDGVTAGGNLMPSSTGYTSLISNVTVLQSNVTTLIANAATQATTLTSIDANLGTTTTNVTALFANAATQQILIDTINSNVAAANALIPNLQAVSSNILPAANVTYSLGSETHQWRDLWISNNTIYIGNTPISVDGGTLLVNNSPIIGNLQIDNNNNQLSFGPGESYSFLYMKNDGSETRLANDNGNVQLSTIKQGLGGGTYYWTFDNTGNLALPNGTRIRDIGTPGVTSGLELGNHGFTMDFGSEINNWAIMSGANMIQVQPDTAFNITFPEIAQWQFNIDGNLTIPGNINYANGVNILDSVRSNYGNVEVAEYLANFDGTINFTASPATITGLGTVSATYANVTAVNATGNVQAEYVEVLGGLISTGASPAPIISGFRSISTGGNYLNGEGNITAAGNLVASRGAFITGNLMVSGNASISNIVYTPTTSSDWAAPAPTTLGQAVDRLAALVKTLNGGTGA